MAFMADPAIAKRNARLIAAYLGGTTAPDLAEHFGMTLSAVRAVLYRAKVRLPKHERIKRGKVGQRAEKADRNARIFAAYRAGALRADLAKQHGLTLDGLNSLLARHGVHLDPAEHYRRLQIGRSRSRSGRRPVWPDCPPELRSEYQRLRVSYGLRAAEARALLEKSHTAKRN